MNENSKQIGDPDDAATQLGPLIYEVRFNRVTGFVQRGQKGQGKLLIGGQRVGDKELFLESTVFTDVDVGSEIHNQEIFGPVSVVPSFKMEDEVMEISNHSNFGLIAGVFTQDINRALRVASDFELGMVGVNCKSLMFFTTPFVGSKDSGIRRACGIAALKAFTELKTVMINLTY